MAAVTVLLSGSPLQQISHCVVMTKAGASFLVMSATNTISGFFIRIFISHFPKFCTGAKIEINTYILITHITYEELRGIATSFKVKYKLKKTSISKTFIMYFF